MRNATEKIDEEERILKIGEKRSLIYDQLFLTSFRYLCIAFFLNTKHSAAIKDFNM